jgi:TRAP-type transport system periplasmic protein
MGHPRPALLASKKSTGRYDMIRTLVKSLASIAVVSSAWLVPAWAQQYTLRLSHQNAPGSEMHQFGMLPWVKKVEEATNGRVKINIYPSQTLAKAADNWKAVKSGVADICWCDHGQWTDMTPLAEVIILPMIPITSAEKGSEVLQKLYEKFPSIQREFDDVKVLFLFTTDPVTLYTTKKQIKTMEDMKGLKIRIGGGPRSEQIRRLGGLPIQLSMPEVYVALDNGVVDGAGTPWEAILSFRFYDIAKYYTLAPLSVSHLSLSMNKAKWNSLPKDIQDQIMSVSGLEGSKAHARATFDQARDKVVEIIKSGKATGTIYKIPPDELARWTKIAGEPIWQDWVKRMEAKGHPEAKEILATTLQMLKE